MHLLQILFILAICIFMFSVFYKDPFIELVTISRRAIDDEKYCLIPNIKQLKKSAIVYTWVNGTESCYNYRRNSRGLSQGGSSRDKEIGELKYSLRSLLKYASWLEGPIYIVTPGQIPDWIDLSNPRIIIVDQDDLLPDDISRPMCNTNVIEQFLYKIPGLTDIFIHMNDDYLFVKPIEPQRLFSCDGGLRFLTEINHIRHVPADSANPWLASVRNTVQFTDSIYGGTHVYNFIKHAPFVYSRKAFELIHSKFAKKLKESAVMPVRSAKDLNMPLLHHIFMNEEGSRLLNIPISWNPLTESDDWLLIRIKDGDKTVIQSTFDRVLGNKGTEVLIALNDEYQDESTAKFVQRFYEQFLPERLSHELPPGSTSQHPISNRKGPKCELDRSIIPFPPKSYVSPISFHPVRDVTKPSAIQILVMRMFGLSVGFSIGVFSLIIISRMVNSKFKRDNMKSI